MTRECFCSSLLTSSSSCRRSSKHCESPKPCGFTKPSLFSNSRWEREFYGHEEKNQSHSSASTFVNIASILSLGMNKWTEDSKTLDNYFWTRIISRPKLRNSKSTGSSINSTKLRKNYLPCILSPSSQHSWFVPETKEERWKPSGVIHDESLMRFHP